MPQWTKEDVIKQSFSEIGKGAYEFDLQPEDMQNALRKLDAMLSAWSGAYGIRLGYAGGDGKGSIGASTTVPDWAYESLYLNLAVKLCPDYGKTPSPVTVKGAKEALDMVRNRMVIPATRSISGYAGAGNSWLGETYIPPTIPALAAGADAEFIIGVGAE